MGIDLEYEPRSTIGQQLYLKGTFESREIDFCHQILKQRKNATVIDIGGNIGIHSLCWARRNPGLASHVFEPSRSTAAILRRNIERNGLEAAITVHELALSNKCGEAAFFECSDCAFSSLKDTRRVAVTTETKVTVQSLDYWISMNPIQRIDLVKIDVEGLEHEVVMGGEQVLRAYKPHIFIEIFGGDNSNAEPEATVEMLCSFGYEPFVFERTGGLRPYDHHSDRNYNYYFSPL